MQSRLEQYVDEVSRPLPPMEREEWRAEVEQHLAAMIDAYEELGYSREAATEIALERFGAAECLGRKMQAESALTRFARHRWSTLLAPIARYSLLWTGIWGTIGVTVTAAAQIWAPTTVGPEGAFQVASRFGLIGAISGAVFGLLMLALESGRETEAAHVFRSAVIGVLAAAMCRSLMFDQMYFTAACILGLAGGLGSSVVLSLFRNKRQQTA